jgi:hypothetical protein
VFGSSRWEQTQVRVFECQAMAQLIDAVLLSAAECVCQSRRLIADSRGLLQASAARKQPPPASRKHI